MVENQRQNNGPRRDGPQFGGRNRRPRGRDTRTPMTDSDGVELFEKVLFINRSSKVVKGGRRFSFSALVVVGNRAGKVGLGLGKASEVADAIRKGSENAKNQMEKVSLRNDTIPHDVLCRFAGAEVLLRPACPGTGVIAGKTVRSVLDAAGVSNVLTKSLGSNNAANVAKATLAALRKLRVRADIFADRGFIVSKAPQSN